MVESEGRACAVAKSFQWSLISVQLKEKIARDLKRAIATGVYPSGGSLEPERELSVKFGVSRGTLRSALATLEDAGLISRLPRQGIRVEAGAQSRLRGSVGLRNAVLFVRWASHGITHHLQNGAQRFLREQGDELLLVEARESHQEFLDAIRHPPRGARGLLLWPYDHPTYHEAIAEAADSGLAVVFVDRVLPSFDFSSVLVDNFGGAYAATDHLIRRHGCPVYFAGYWVPVSCTQDRHRGWAEAMRMHGFRDAESYTIAPAASEYELMGGQAEPQVSQFFARLHDLLRSDAQDTYCIFAVNDGIAQTIYDVAAQAGRTVGRDVFLVSFDDEPGCQRLDPPLSSVHQPMEQMGYEGARLLYETIAGRVPRPIHTVLPVTLKARASSTGELAEVSQESVP